MSTPIASIPFATSSSGSSSTGNDLVPQPQITVSSLFSEACCYDLLPQSRKGVVFETSISFQFAFFALIEHDTYVAPLWDPERKTFVALMTLQDYILALQVCRAQGVSMMELSTKTIRDVLQSQFEFKHPEFASLDAEDSLLQLCLLLRRRRAAFVPIVDPDEGALVGILGHLDLLHFLDLASKQHPQLFSGTLEQLNIGSFSNVVTAPLNTPLAQIIGGMEERGLVGVPIVDDNGVVVGLYHSSEMTFIIKARDADGVLENLKQLTVGQALELEKQPGDENITSISHKMVTCSAQDRLTAVIDLMMSARTTIAVCVDSRGQCTGVVTLNDIIDHFVPA